MLVFKDGRLEDLGIGQEGDLGARLIRLADDGERTLRHAAVVDLAVDVAVLIDLRLQPFGERVDRLDADAVQTARNFIARVSAELTARVDLGKDDLHRRNALFGVDLGGDAAAVVLDRARTVHVDGDFDVRAVARKRFVDGVIDDLAHEMMQPPLVRGADIHTGALADVLEAVEHLDLFRAVCALYLFGHRNLRRANRPFSARVRARAQIYFPLIIPYRRKKVQYLRRAFGGKFAKTRKKARRKPYTPFYLFIRGGIRRTLPAPPAPPNGIRAPAKQVQALPFSMFGGARYPASESSRGVSFPAHAYHSFIRERYSASPSFSAHCIR